MRALDHGDEPRRAFRNFRYFPADSKPDAWLACCERACGRGMPLIAAAISLHRDQEWPDTQDIHDACEVVGEHMQRHLGGDARQGLHQKMCCSHSRFGRPEGMLDRLATHAHLSGVFIKSALNRFQKILVLPQRVTRRCGAGVH